MIDLTDEQLIEAHNQKKLSELVGTIEYTNQTGYIKLDDTLKSNLYYNAMKSFLGRATPSYENKIPRLPVQLKQLVDRLYYLLLKNVDQSAAQGRVAESDYDISREDTELCFYTADTGVFEKQTIVSLIRGTNFTYCPFYVINRFAPEPDIEIAALIKKQEISVLDAGIGHSTAILKVKQRLEQLGKSVITHGINLIKMPQVCQLSFPCFEGIFEQFEFPIKFDLVYSNVGSSFYTPDVPAYLDKLMQILNPDGVALLNIHSHEEWDDALKQRGTKHTFLKDIPTTELYKYTQNRGDPTFCDYKPGQIKIQLLPENTGIDITGVLIQNS